MTSPWLSFAAVKQGVRMEAVLRHYQLQGLAGHGGRYRGRCPLHQGEGRESFHVDVQRKIFHCFSCGAGGDVLDLVARLEQCTVREAAGRLQDWFPDVDTCAGPLARQRVTKGNSCIPGRLPFTLRGVDGRHAYLGGRGIDAGTAAWFGAGFYAGPGILSGRMVIPIHDERGQLVAYAGRSVDGRLPRYRFPAGFGKSRVLFNFHRAAATAADTVVVVEGFFDCMCVHRAGYGNVVALLGTELYEHPAKLLQHRFGRVVLMLDGDEAGRSACERVSARLKPHCQVRVIRLPEGVQPDQLADCHLRQWIGTAIQDGK